MEHTPAAPAPQSKLDTPKAIVLGALIIGIGLGLGLGLGGGTNTSKQPKDRRVDVADIVKRNDIDRDAYQACIADPATQMLVRDDMARAQQAGISGTPGVLVTDSQTGNAVLVGGAQPLPVFQQTIDALVGGHVDPEDMVWNGTEVDADEHLQGAADARIILTEYSDYDCPFCGRVHPTLQALQGNSNGEIAWAYRHLPLESIHPDALPKAVASECIAQLGGNEAFWDFTDTAFTSGVKL